jgi:tetratricopeptide (TPR) repeat protein
VLALIVRIFYLVESSANPTFHAPIADSNYYDFAANDLIRTHQFSALFFFQPVFYPLFLTGVYILSGASIVAVKIIQVAAGSAACAVVCLLGERTFGRTTGLLAGLIAAFYGPMIFADGELLAEGWAALWTVLIMWLLHTGAPSLLPRPSSTKGGEAAWKKVLPGGALTLNRVLLGTLFALSVLTRPTFLPFCGLAGIWLLFKTWKEQKSAFSVAGAAAAVALSFAVVMAPALVLFHEYTGSCTFLPTSGGVNFFMGNNPDYEKTVAVRPGSHYHAMINQAFKEGIILENEVEKSRYFYEKTLHYALKQPAAFAAGLFQKSIQLISSREIPNNIDIYLFRDWSFLLRTLVWKAGKFGFPFGLLLPFAMAGIFFAWKKVPVPWLLFLFSYSFSLVLVHVCGRFRIPMMPILILLASAGFVELTHAIRSISWWKREHRGLLPVGGAVILACSIISWAPGPFALEKTNYRAEMYNLISEFHMMRDNFELAKEAASKALEIDPGYADAYTSLALALTKVGDGQRAMDNYLKAIRCEPDNYEALNNMGELMLDRGQPDEALHYFESALANTPDALRNAEVTVNMGLALLGMGKPDDAIERFTQALSKEPQMAEAFNGIGIACFQKGSFGKAIENYRQALAIRPSYAQARVNLGAAYAEAGNFDEAISHYRDALRVEPSSSKAHFNLGLALASTGRLDDAIEEYVQAVEISPGYTKAQLYLADALMRRGDYGRAVAYLEVAARARPDSAPVRELLERAYKLKAGG